MRFIPKSLAVTGWTALIVCCFVPAEATPPPSYTGPRTVDPKPDINRIWQAMNTSNWDLSPHSAKVGSIASQGAQGAEPGGVGVVEGGAIPYLPEALKTRADNYQKRFTGDPEIKCYMPGVPRAVYMPFPFQIVQSSKVILVSYEFAASSRTIFLGAAPAVDESWMGTSAGHWEGDTLVVDVTGLVDRTWFDRAGDFHSDALHVVERYTPVTRDVLNYEATIEDSKVFSRPWKMSMPLYRHMEKNAQLMEFKCVEFAEELLYGHLRKQPSK